MLESEDLDPATASYHEAGHVLMAHLLGGRVVGASIEPDEDEWMGQTAVEWSGADAVERARRTALVALAGPVAESWWRGEASVVDALTCWREDWQEDARLGYPAGPAYEEALGQHLGAGYLQSRPSSLRSGGCCGSAI